MRQKFKAQAIVEYALIGALVIAAVLPAIQPLSNNIGLGVKNSAPKPNTAPYDDVGIGDKAGSARTGTVNNADPDTSAITDPSLNLAVNTPDTPEAPPDPIKRVYMYATSVRGNLLNTFGWAFNNEQRAMVNFDGILDRIDKTTSNDKYNEGVFLFNEDGSLNAYLDGEILQKYNEAKVTHFKYKGKRVNKGSGTIGNPDIDSLNYAEDNGYVSFNQSSGGMLNLPDGSQIYVINNAFSPIIFDLNGDGIRTTEHTIMYDINGDGKKDKINDVKVDGVLCIRGGKSGLDLFGDNTDLNNDGKRDGFRNGFEALKFLARKEKLIDDKDDMILDKKDIKVLAKKHSLALKIGYLGKTKDILDAGITEIALPKTSNTKLIRNFDGKGNMLMLQDGATIKIHGKTNIFADLWHAVTDTVSRVVKSVTNMFK